MKKIYNKLLATLLLVTCFYGCSSEDIPENKWEYPGPRPEIKNGPSIAQKMCYNLYQKYDLHPYYTLSGDEALIGELGFAQRNSIISKNPKAIPMEAADENTAEKFMKLLTDFYDSLPKELATKGLHKRHVLVKVIPANNNHITDSGNTYWYNTHTEDMQAVVYYGYLQDLSDESGDKFDTNFADWKWNISYQFFRGLAVSHYKNFPLSLKFGLISKGLYYYENRTGVDVCVKMDAMRRYVFFEDIGKKCGFVHPMGAMSGYERPEADWGSYVAWILNTPKSERDIHVVEHEKIKLKYNMVINYFNDTYKLNLEDLALKWQSVVL